MCDLARLLLFANTEKSFVGDHAREARAAGVGAEKTRFTSDGTWKTRKSETLTALKSLAAQPVFTRLKFACTWAVFLAGVEVFAALAGAVAAYERTVRRA